MKNLSLFSDLGNIETQSVEIVERKGVGHPDTLADGLAESISIAYSKYCLQNFGAILHHNFDKVAIAGGLVEADFSVSKILKPARVVINGRASTVFGDSPIDVPAITEEAARDYLKRVLPSVDADSYFTFIHQTTDYSHNPFWFHPRSIDDLPENKFPHANDSSTFSSYWPLSPLEQTALSLEALLHKFSGPEYILGEDVKVLATRKGRNIGITLCIPQISSKTPSFEVYKTRIQEMQKRIEDLARQMLPRSRIDIFINTADGSSGEKYYLLATGSCIEAGEEGVVGRGNGSRGVIASMRSSGAEAVAGKNPVYHVGKVWAAICDSLSKNIAERFECSCEVHIATKNGDYLYEPEHIIINTDKPINKTEAAAIVEAHTAHRGWTNAIIHKEIFIPRIGRGNDYVINI